MGLKLIKVLTWTKIGKTHLHTVHEMNFDTSPQGQEDIGVLKKCQSCDEYFTTEEFLLEHVKKAHNLKNLVETPLKMKGKEENSLNEEVIKKDTETPYFFKCTGCSKDFLSKDAIKEHNSGVDNMQKNALKDENSASPRFPQPSKFPESSDFAP